MHLDTTDLQAEVYATNKDKNILYIKFTIPGLRMYINSCTVRPSVKFDGLWFQMPAFFMGRRFVSPIEFRGDSQFLDLLKDAAMRAADQYIRDEKLFDLFPGAERTGTDKVLDEF